jgi:hypothetical protein
LFFAWCTDQNLDPLTVQRAQIERYVRWMQEIRRFKPSTVSRRMAVVTGFYRTCVIDAVVEHSPADYVRRPFVPAESPTLGLSHLQFEAFLTAARESPNVVDFALVTMLGLLGLRILEACAADIKDVGEEHGHRVLRVHGKGSKIVLVPLPPAVGRVLDRATADRTSGPILLNRRGVRMDGTAPLGGCVAWPRCRWCGRRGCIRTCCATSSSPPCSTPGSICGTSRSPPATPIPAPRCDMTEPAKTLTGTRTTSLRLHGLGHMTRACRSAPEHTGMPMCGRGR